MHVCVILFVCLRLSVMSCQHASQRMNVKTVQRGIAKAAFLTAAACLCFLPPRPKLLPPFGLPKPPLAGRLVEGQESANQGRPGSPAFNKPGRLREDVQNQTKGDERWKGTQRTSDTVKYSAYPAMVLLIFFLLHQQQIDVKTHSAYSRLWSSRAHGQQ